jgi:hypothetical protein
MSNNSDFLNDLFSAYRNTSDYKDTSMMEIVCRRKEFEQNLDDMWAIYRKNPRQIVEYNKGLNQIKETGLKVFRNSEGKHKIVVPK